MPCAEGELCQLQDTTPQAPHGHGGYSCGNGRLIFCGALPVVLVVFFFSCNIEAGAPGKQGGICPDVR